MNTRTNTMLTMQESFMLAQIVKERYQSSGLNNVAFAKSVNDTEKERKQFRNGVTSRNVHSVVEALGLPQNIVRPPKETNEDCVFLAGRVAQLEDQMNKLTTWLKKERLYPPS